jgi:hypothetical protein
MIRSRCSLGPISPRLLAILIVAVVPAIASADTVIFTNECRAPVVVHTSCVVKGRLVRNKPQVLRPLERTTAITRTNDLSIIICDAGGVNRVLFQGALRGGKEKLHLGIVPVPKIIGKVAVLKRPLPAMPKP